MTNEALFELSCRKFLAVTAFASLGELMRESVVFNRAFAALIFSFFWIKPKGQ